MLTDGDLQAIWLTVRLAGLVTLILLLVGTPIAWWLARTPSRWKGAIGAVVDACDQIKAKTAMAAWARETGTLFVSVGAAGGKRHAHKVDIDDLSATTHDPLLAQLRYRLRKHHQAPREGRKIGVTCVFSREAVAAPDASCAV